MSRRKSDEEYSRTRAYKFFRWLSGQKDPYVGVVELVPQKEESLSEKELEAIRYEHFDVVADAHDYDKNKSLKFFNKVYRIMAVIFCLLLLTGLIFTVSYLPPTGEANKAVNNEVTQRYIEKGLKETGAVNIVTGMILDYRAFDTFGESNVLFVATVTVLILLHFNKKQSKAVSQTQEMNRIQASIDAEDRDYEPKNDLILQLVARLLVPIIMIFGIYVVLNGHISPGGGFSGGAIIGAGLILYLNAFGFEKTEKFFTEKTYKWISFGALSTYCLCKTYSFYCGANHLESHIPLGIPGHILSSGLILILNICVGCVVACTMYTFYVMFRKGDF